MTKYGKQTAQAKVKVTKAMQSYAKLCKAIRGSIKKKWNDIKPCITLVVDISLLMPVWMERHGTWCQMDTTPEPMTDQLRPSLSGSLVSTQKGDSL